MKEILFRGVSTDSIEWVEGWFEMYPYGRWPLKETIIPAEEAKEGYFHHVEVIPETVGQFTVLTDKKGKKIFEGDIVRAHFRTNHSKQTFRVIFEDGMFLFDNKCVEVPKYDIYGMEIIGNIHDNPELLEG